MLKIKPFSLTNSLLKLSTIIFSVSALAVSSLCNANSFTLDLSSSSGEIKQSSSQSNSSQASAKLNDKQESTESSFTLKKDLQDKGTLINLPNQDSTKPIVEQDESSNLNTNIRTLSSKNNDLKEQSSLIQQSIEQNDNSTRKTTTNIANTAINPNATKTSNKDSQEKPLSERSSLVKTTNTSVQSNSLIAPQKSTRAKTTQNTEKETSLNPPPNNNIFPARVTKALHQQQELKNQNLVQEQQNSMQQSLIKPKSSTNLIDANLKNIEETPRMVVIYFSQPEHVNIAGNVVQSGLIEASVDELTGASIVQKNQQQFGTVEYIAQYLAKLLHIAYVKIEADTPYPLDHDALIEVSSNEFDNNIYRAMHLNPKINLDDFDTIFLGYPLWWFNPPSVVTAFLKQYDLSGKTIIPFCSHSGSDNHESFKLIQQLEPNAKVDLLGLNIHRNAPQQDLESLLKNFLKKKEISFPQEQQNK